MRKVSSKISTDDSSVDESEIDRILLSFDADVVFVHVGLSDIATVVDGDPYEFLLERLESNFDSVLAPGFTPEFRSCGVYHKEYSRPAYGRFSKRFHKDADHRTDDAIHSILVSGDYRFPDKNHRSSFGESSCWAKLDEDNVLYLNIGTNEFVTTQLHHIEVRNDLPYIAVPTHEGVVYYDETEHEKTSQRNYDYEYDFFLNSSPNWRKLRRFLSDRGVLEDHSRGPVRLYSFRARDVRLELESKLRDDPYYLIT